MKTRKIMTIFGTRPEAIKMAPLVLALQDTTDFIPRIVVTGQHRSILDQVLDLFGLVPDHDLDIGRDRQTLAGVTERALAGLDGLIAEEKPDLVVVQGDTTTNFPGPWPPSITRSRWLHGGRAPHRRSVLAVSRGDQPAPDHPAGRPSSGAHAHQRRQPQERERRPRRRDLHRQYGHRRPVRGPAPPGHRGRPDPDRAQQKRPAGAVGHRPPPGIVGRADGSHRQGPGPHRPGGADVADRLPHSSEPGGPRSHTAGGGRAAQCSLDRATRVWVLWI